MSIIGNISRVLGWETGRSLEQWAKAWIPGTDESKRGWAAAYVAFKALGVLFSRAQANDVPDIGSVAFSNHHIVQINEIQHREEQPTVRVNMAQLKEKQTELIQKVFPEMPPHRIESFRSVIEGFYGKVLSEGKAPKEALAHAFGKGMAWSLVGLPSGDEIEADEELQKKIEADPEFKPYTCVINGDLVISDGVYLREDASHTPRERYHDKAIRDWITAHRTDPVERSARTVADIKPDYKGQEFIRNKLLGLLHPELSIESSGSSDVEGLYSKSFMLALGAAYLAVKTKHRRVAGQPQSSPALIEISARKILDRFASLVEGMNFEGEEVAAACFPAIKNFLRQAEKKLTAENLGEVREKFLKKLGTLVTYFHEIEPVKVSAALKEKALKLGAEAIGKGASLEDVMELFEAQLAVEKALLKQEDDIRAAFPGCLLGEAEWITHLGVVDKVPLPEGMLAILRGPCPIIPDKKVGETHILVLIPETVGGQPLTLNSLGALVKSKGHFPDTTAGYSDMYGPKATEHGNKPAGGSHYVLMTKDVLPGSRTKRYAAQQAMVTELAGRSGAAYEVPTVLSVAAGVLVNYLASGGTRLFSDAPWTYTRCQEEIGAYRVIVGGFAAAGLKVYSFAYVHAFHGVAALRKF